MTKTNPVNAGGLGRKFANAFRGAGVAIRGGNGFALHGAAAAAVGVVGWLAGCTRVEWLVLILCVTAVLAAELFNTAIEHLARAVTLEEHPEVRNALDIAAAGVLCVAIGAKVVWVVILASRLYA